MVLPQTLARDGRQMYRKVPDRQLSFEDFYLPFGGTLSGNNRWARLARIIPWDLAESFYAEQFSQNPQGPSASKASSSSFVFFRTLDRAFISSIA